MPDIHIYVHDAFYEARNLRMQSDELAQETRRLTEAAEQLSNVWRGPSARRVLEAMVKRADDAEKIANNLSVISDGLQETAEVYQAAQQPGGGLKRMPVTPRKRSVGVKVDVTFVSSKPPNSTSG